VWWSLYAPSGREVLRVFDALNDIRNVERAIAAVRRTGDVLLVLEAMKMETNITAPGPGKIAAIPVKEGDSVQSGQVVVEFE
jgi:methylmalonyl-CoA carboxyltransferase small subunit